MLCFGMQQHFTKSFLGWQSLKDLHQQENLSAKLFLGTPSPNDFPPENDTQEFAKVWGPSTKVLSARRQLGQRTQNQRICTQRTHCSLQAGQSLSDWCYSLSPTAPFWFLDPRCLMTGQSLSDRCYSQSQTFI